MIHVPGDRTVLCEPEGQDWSEATLEIASDPPEARGEAWNISSLPTEVSKDSGSKGGEVGSGHTSLMTSISSPCFPEMDRDFLFMSSEWHPQPEYGS